MAAIPTTGRAVDHPDYKNKNQDILNFIEKFKNNNNIRNPLKFGGSEFASIIGVDPYRTIDETIQNKVNRRYVFSIAAAWGDLTEDYLRTYLQNFWGTEIHELPMSVPSQYPSFCYSGDGGGVLISPGNGELFRVLFEFKNPLQRVPKDGIVPAHYIPQPMSGLANSNIGDVFDCAVFVDALFRACSYRQFDFNLEHNQNVHAFPKLPADAAVVDMGFIALYRDPARCTQEIDTAISDLRELAYSTEPIIDLGAEPKIILEGFLRLCNKNKPYERLHFYNGPFVQHTLNVLKQGYSLAGEIEKFKTFCAEREYSPVAIIPLKLFKIVVVPMGKDPAYIDKYIKYLDSATEKLRLAFAERDEKK